MSFSVAKCQGKYKRNASTAQTASSVFLIDTEKASRGGGEFEIVTHSVSRPRAREKYFNVDTFL